jgi:hypothetical protein
MRAGTAIVALHVDIALVMCTLAISQGLRRGGRQSGTFNVDVATVQ